MTEQEKAQAAAEDSEEEAAPLPPAKMDKRKKQLSDDGSDTDFHVGSDEDTEVEPDEPEGPQDDARQELVVSGQARDVSGLAKQSPARPKSGDVSRFSDQPPQASPAKSPKKRSSGKPPISSSEPAVTVFRVNKKEPHPKKDAKEPAVISLLSPSPSPKLTCLAKPFVRAHIPLRSPYEPTHHTIHICQACHKNHPPGACDLKAAGVEHCGLCGLAHYGYGRTCPHIKSETQVREMLAALKNSPEKKELIDAAAKYLRGVKGTLVQQKKRDRERAEGRSHNPDAAVPAAARPPHLLAGNAPHLLAENAQRTYPNASQPRFPYPDQPANLTKGVSRPHVPPQRAAQQLPGRPGMGAGHAQGQFVERDVEDALRGFLRQ